MLSVNVLLHFLNGCLSGGKRRMAFSELRNLVQLLVGG